MNVWCTLVMLKSEYACGAAAVAQSLANVGSKDATYVYVQLTLNL